MKPHEVPAPPAVGSETVASPTECRYCTVPVEAGDICAFCRSYSPPPESDALTTGLADSHATAITAADQLGALIATIPGTAPLWSVVDITGAAAHMRAAARLIDRAATRITAAEVTR